MYEIWCDWGLLRSAQCTTNFVWAFFYIYIYIYIYNTLFVNNNKKEAWLFKQDAKTTSPLIKDNTILPPPPINRSLFSSELFGNSHCIHTPSSHFPTHFLTYWITFGPLPGVKRIIWSSDRGGAKHLDTAKMSSTRPKNWIVSRFCVAEKIPCSGVPMA